MNNPPIQTGMIAASIDTIMKLVLDYIHDELTRTKATSIAGAEVKKALGLSLETYPLDSKTQGKTGWLMSILTRRMQDNGFIKYYMVGNKGMIELTPKARAMYQFGDAP